MVIKKKARMIAPLEIRCGQLWPGNEALSQYQSADGKVAILGTA
jgi:hypothetical protein